jgi:hypothetical protein
VKNENLKLDFCLTKQGSKLMLKLELRKEDNVTLNLYQTERHLKRKKNQGPDI